jgi:hypothetical protein
MGALQLTYEPKLKIVHRTGELMRSHEAKSVQLWLSTDPLAEVSPHESPYIYCSNNPIMFVDPTGMIKELPDDQKLGKGDWHKSDRENNTDVWKNANKHNLQQANGSLEYSTISQRTAFYGWFQSETESKGFETKWAGAAYVIANQMTNMENPLLNWAFSSEVIKFAHDGNKAIFDNVVPKLKNLYNGSILKGEDAKKWDKNTLTVEQRDIVGPIYKRQTSETLTTLSKMAKQEGIYSLGVFMGNSPKLKFNGNINNWQDRYNHGMNVAVKAWEELKSAPLLKFTIPRPIQR